MKSLIKFSEYSIKEVREVMKKDAIAYEIVIQLHVDFIIDSISEAGNIEIPSADANIVFYIAGFIAKGLTKKFKCVGCINMLGSRGVELLMPIWHMCDGTTVIRNNSHYVTV